MGAVRVGGPLDIKAPSGPLGQASNCCLFKGFTNAEPGLSGGPLRSAGPAGRCRRPAGRRAGPAGHSTVCCGLGRCVGVRACARARVGEQRVSQRGYSKAQEASIAAHTLLSRSGTAAPIAGPQRPSESVDLTPPTGGENSPREDGEKENSEAQGYSVPGFAGGCSAETVAHPLPLAVALNGVALASALFE